MHNQVQNNINGGNDHDQNGSGHIWPMNLDELPPGIRFMPKDEELIQHYLVPKSLNRRLPTNIVKEVDIYKHSPDQLAEMYRSENDRIKELYFFTPRERRYVRGERPNRSAGKGFWKATGGDAEVEIDGKVMGHKKSLAYFIGKPPRGERKTHWLMHEFRLESPPPKRPREGLEDMRLDECLCKIYEKGGNSSKSEAEEGVNEEIKIEEPNEEIGQDGKELEAKQENVSSKNLLHDNNMQFLTSRVQEYEDFRPEDVQFCKRQLKEYFLQFPIFEAGPSNRQQQGVSNFFW